MKQIIDPGIGYLLNFASGLPYAIIISVSVIMYKTWDWQWRHRDIHESLYLPCDKTIMESIYRLVRHQEKMVLAMQLVISIAFLLVGLTIPMNNFFVISLLFFGRGFCISFKWCCQWRLLYVIRERTTIFFPRNTQYLLSPSMLTGNGLIVIIAGFLNRNMEINRKRGPTPWSLSVLLWLP
jgi:PAT family beta-lactamase induction signal transducer AmpG